jgi:hypothetical protein
MARSNQEPGRGRFRDRQAVAESMAELEAEASSFKKS